MGSRSLPILMPNLPWQKYSCHGCGDCCRDFTVQLRERDLKKLSSQGWAERFGTEVVQSFRGQSYLSRKDDGSCVFLNGEGLCKIHAEFGFSEKPIACQVFPFNIAPDESGVRVGLNFLCKSVQRNEGSALGTHQKDIRRFVQAIPELSRPAPDPLLASGETTASRSEITKLVDCLDQWLSRPDLEFLEKLDGLAFIATCLGDATLTTVRNERFSELLDTLFSVLQEELRLQPIASPSRRQERLLRQAVFTRTEDPRIGTGKGRFRSTVSQLRRNRAMRLGRGRTPFLTAELPSGVDFRAVAGVAGCEDSPDLASIAELFTRYLRATLHAGRAWGSAYYGWSVTDGLQAVVLNTACILWIAKLSSASESRTVALLKDYQLAIGRVDRQAGRAPWLGNPVERIRLNYLRMDHGLRRLIHGYL